jgi:hypothetical protein
MTSRRDRRATPGVEAMEARVSLSSFTVIRGVADPNLRSSAVIRPVEDPNI